MRSFACGHPDRYPFTPAQPVIEKLDFVPPRVRVATAAAMAK